MQGDNTIINGDVVVMEPGYLSYQNEESVLAGMGVNVVRLDSGSDAVALLKTLNPVAILVRERAVGGAEIDVCPNLKAIVRYGVGVDNIDLDAATKAGVKVANIPDYGAAIEVSEHAVALYLAVQRRIVSRDQEVRDGQWGIGQRALIPSRENARLGLIGCGRIGLAAAGKFRALGFAEVVAFDPHMDAAIAQQHDINLVSLSDLCSTSDVVSLHAPLTQETHHVLGAKQIAQMKATTIVVNVSRGGLVDEAALAQALHEGRIFGAGIDVFEREPLTYDNPLLGSPNTVLSDHAAWYSERSVNVIQRKAAEELRRVLSGENPLNWVNAVRKTPELEK